MTHTRVDVSVVIVTWNSGAFIEKCLSSLHELTCRHSFEVIVVDNASADETVQLVERGFPEVRVVQTGANLGYAPAVNIGVRLAQGRHIFLLNPDSAFENDVIGELVDVLAAHREAGMVAPRLVYEDGEVCIYSARGYPSLGYAILNQLGFLRVSSRTRLANSNVQVDWDSLSPTVVPALGGAALMIPRAVIDEVGLLDEQIPMYFEDIDLCQRISRTGRSLYYVPSARLLHHDGQSAEISPIRAVLYALEQGQALRMYIQKYEGEWHARAFSVAVFLGSLLRLAAYTVLYPAAALGGRQRKAHCKASLVKSRALLAWSMTSKEEFKQRVWDLFLGKAGSDARASAGVGNPQRVSALTEDVISRVSGKDGAVSTIRRVAE